MGYDVNSQAFKDWAATQYNQQAGGASAPPGGSPP
jgi:hypothetical protein